MKTAKREFKSGVDESTSEEAGSLHRVEDWLGVVRTGNSVDDLKRFLNRWDATIAGMETPQMIWFSETSCLGKSESVI